MVKKLEGAGLRGQVAGETSLIKRRSNRRLSLQRA